MTSVAHAVRGNFVTTLESSGTVFSGNGVVFKIYSSTGNDLDYAVALDTQVLENSVYANFVAAAIKSPNLIFQSTVANAVQSISNIDYGPEGAYLNNGLYIWFSDTSERHQVTVIWK